MKIMCNNHQVIAVHVNFKMAAAVILDLVGSNKCW